MTGIAAPSLSVLIAQYGKTELTERAVDAIRRSDYPGEIEVLVYDNASPTGPGAVAERDDVKLVLGEHNVGFGPAMNALADKAGGDLLLLLNNDTIVEPRCIRRLVTRLQAPDRPGAVSPQYRTFEGRILEMGGYLGPGGEGWQLFRGSTPPESLQRIPYRAHYGSAACLLVSRAAFLDYGGFDERYAPAYYEDTDLCVGLAHRGLHTVVEPRAVVFHYEGATAGRDVASGLKAYQARHRTVFRDRWSAWLGGLRPVGLGAALSAAFTPEPGRSRVLWLTPVLPHPDRDAGANRMLKMIRALREAGDFVGLWAEYCHDADRYGQLLEAMGVPWFGRVQPTRWALDAPSEALLQTLPEVLETVDWDTVIVSFPRLARRVTPTVRTTLPRAAIIVDNVDLHFLRQERATVLGLATPMPVEKADELAAYRGADGVVTASDLETEILRRELPALAVRTFAVAAQPPVEPSPERKPTHLTFLGNFHHPPNLDAVQWWVSDLAWRVEERAGRPIVLRVVGSASEIYAETWIQNSGGRVAVAGWVDDLAAVFQESRVFLAPLRFGAGTKGKIADALAFGVPIVTTTVGAEGIAPEISTAFRLADDPDTLAAAIAELMTDDAAWRRQREATRAAARLAWEHQSGYGAAFADWVRARAAGGESAPRWRRMRPAPRIRLRRAERPAP